MTVDRGSQLPRLSDPASLGPLFDDNRLPMWVHDGATLELLAANRAARASYGWDDEALRTLRLDDVHPRGVVSAQEFAHGDGTVWVVTELDGVERRQHDADHDRVLHELIAVQEQVRTNIAERLHDGPIQTLTAVSLRIGLLKRSVDAALEPKLAEAERLVVDALAGLREEMNAHRGHGEVAADLAGAISSTLRWLGLDERYTIMSAGPEPGGSIAALFYRVSQDLLAATKHRLADGPTRTIQIRWTPTSAQLDVPVADGVELGDRLSAWVLAMDGSVERIDGSVVVSVPTTIEGSA